MGQYYDILLKKENRYAHYDRSVDNNYTMAKLTEHSWWANDMLGAVCRLIYEEPTRVYWIGDYANGAEPVNGLSEAEIAKLYGKCYGSKALKERTLSGQNTLMLDEKFLVNHSKLEYIDCSEYRKKSTNNSGWTLHPLSLMTAIGNGRGGGDYRGINENRIGEWAGDLISVEDKAPENYRKNNVYFKEEW